MAKPKPTPIVPNVPASNLHAENKNKDNNNNYFPQVPESYEKKHSD